VQIEDLCARTEATRWSGKEVVRNANQECISEDAQRDSRHARSSAV
jgi:hypothetical protein